MVVWISKALEIITGLADCRPVHDAMGPMVDNPKVVFALGLTLPRTDYLAAL
jgi:hypothetical protein